MNLNGHRLVAALPVFAGRDVPEYYVIVADRTDRPEAVTATMATLDDPEWCDGQYAYGDGCVSRALSRMYQQVLGFVPAAALDMILGRGHER